MNAATWRHTVWRHFWWRHTKVSVRAVKKGKTLTQSLFIISRVTGLMKITSTIVCDRDGCKLVLPLFSGWLNGRIRIHIDFYTGSGFTRTSDRDLLKFTRKLQICSNFERWETFLYVTQWISVTMKSIERKYFIYKQAVWAKSCMKSFRHFHKMAICGRSCMVIRPICKKTTVDSSNALFCR